MSGSIETWLWLLLVMKPHNPKTFHILSVCGFDVAGACAGIRDGVYPFLSSSEKRAAHDVRLGKVRELINICNENEIQIVPYDHEDYPERLRGIDNPPVVLFVKGSLSGLKDRLLISAVGARDASDYSNATATKVCEGLAEANVGIVSGLAVGLDTAAHRAALDKGGYTAGVLACGHLVNYPEESEGLKREIIESGGAVISELLPYTDKSSDYFHIRNRIISGMTHGTLVLQARERSGTLLTANHAFGQGRQVFFIPPHDIFDNKYSGAARLYRDGAKPVFSVADILDGFEILSELLSIKRPPGSSYKPGRVKKKTAVKPAEETQSAVTADAESVNEAKEAPKSGEVPDGLTENEILVYKALINSPAISDTLTDRTGLDFSRLSECLILMEVNGVIERLSDGTYRITR